MNINKLNGLSQKESYLIQKLFISKTLQEYCRQALIKIKRTGDMEAYDEFIERHEGMLYAGSPEDYHKYKNLKEVDGVTMFIEAKNQFLMHEFVRNTFINKKG